jgi:hypothetical protein
VNFTLTLGEQDFASWTQADTDALIAAIKAETGAAQVNITIESGSVKAVVDVVLPSGSDQAAKDAVLAKVDTVPKLNAILAASPSATLQTAAGQNNTATTPVVKTVQITSELVGSSVVGGNVIFDILGAYQAIQWKSGGNWITLASPFPTSAFGEVDGAQTIEFRLLSPDSSVLGIPASISVAFPTLGPTLMYHWLMDGDLNDSGPLGTHLDESITGANPNAIFTTVEGRQGLQSYNYDGWGTNLRIPFDRSKFTSGITYMLWVRKQSATNQTGDQAWYVEDIRAGFMLDKTDPDNPGSYTNKFHDPDNMPDGVYTGHWGNWGSHWDDIYTEIPDDWNNNSIRLFPFASTFPGYYASGPTKPTSGTVNFGVANDGGAKGQPVWHHLAVTVELADGKRKHSYYSNGVLTTYWCHDDAETELPDADGIRIFFNDEPLWHLQNIYGPSYTGEAGVYSDIRLYAGALTEAEVNAVYTA